MLLSYHLSFLTDIYRLRTTLVCYLLLLNTTGEGKIAPKFLGSNFIPHSYVAPGWDLIFILLKEKVEKNKIIKSCFKNTLIYPQGKIYIFNRFHKIHCMRFYTMAVLHVIQDYLGSHPMLTLRSSNREYGGQDETRSVAVYGSSIFLSLQRGRIRPVYIRMVL